MKYKCPKCTEQMYTINKYRDGNHNLMVECYCDKCKEYHYFTEREKGYENDKG